MVFPFLKWAGGKRWLVENFSQHLPVNYNRYFEPFLGGGSVFFYLSPKKSYLSDLNKELIETYLSLRDDWKDVLSVLLYHKKRHSRDYYYDVRSEVPKCKIERAARFIYLNRTCWNGLYRVNRDGKFNVPLGTKTSVILKNDDFESVSSYLKGATIVCDDFEHTISKAQKNDFIFIDPPYTINHSNNGFIKYNEKLFTWDDQVRLSESVRHAKNRGAKICLLNADHDSIRELYDGFDQVRLSRKSVIAGKSQYRGTFTELLIR